MTYLCLRGRQRGIAKISLVILVVIMLVPVVVVGFYEGRKAYWDYRVREMCAKDGGVNIREVIDVDEGTYKFLANKFGQVDIPRRGDPRSSGSVAVHFYTDTYIRRNDPEVRRSEIAVVRTSNGEVVATSTTYSRVGGDLFALHPSYFSCPNAPGDFFASVINLKGDKR